MTITPSPHNDVNSQEYTVKSGIYEINQVNVNGFKSNFCSIKENGFVIEKSQHEDCFKHLFIALHNYKNQY